MIKSEAVKLQTEYQPKLRDGIKIAVDLVNSVQKDKQDGDVDALIHIYPNTKKEKATVKQNINKQGDHIFNSNLKSAAKQIGDSLSGVAGLEGLKKYFDNAYTAFSNYPFNVTSVNEGVMKGGDANSRSYGRTKEQLVERFDKYIEQKKEGLNADPSGLDTLIGKWLDVAYDSDAVNKLSGKIKTDCEKAKSTTIPKIKENIIAEVPSRCERLLRRNGNASP